jgi:HAD superfamily hydrolase (TIGR01549 family)
LTTTTAATLGAIDLSRCRLLVLDFDGVVTRLPLDWPAIRRELASRCLENFGLEVSFSPVSSGRERVLEERGLRALARVDGWLAEREMAALDGAALLPGVVDLLAARPGADVAICSSNARAMIHEALRRFGISERVRAVVGREDVSRLKPSPEGLLKILDATGCPRGEAVFVGDRDVDAAAGEAAGIRTWIVAGEETERLDRIASAHSYEEGFNGRLTRYRARAIREMVPAGGSLLELGCGTGALAAELAGHFSAMTVVEGSESCIRTARERLPAGSRCIRSLVENLRLDGSFSCVLASGLLEHVAEPVGVIRSASGWLEADGVAVFLVPNARSLHRRIGVQMGLLSRLDELQAHDHDVGHRRYYTREALRSDIETAGLEVIRESGVYLKPLANHQMEGWDEALADAFDRVGRELPDWCAELIAAGRKGRPAR